MIQCKREKELGPTRVRKIIEDAVDSKNPPYGYILAAPANFSKKAYDEFRTTLVNRGVQEFHLFGRAELEDMLYMPKNDRILFAFFGVSLSSKKRTRVSDIRTTVNNKNKLYSVLEAADDGLASAHVLIRDINDKHYPDETKYPDFDEKPRWKEYIASQFYAEGVRFNSREYFGYINHETKEWDYCPAVDLLYRESDHQNVEREEREKTNSLREKAQSFWEHLPRSLQGKYVVDGFVSYANFSFIDKRGDPAYKFPHLYIDFGNKGPFDSAWYLMKYGHDEWHSLDGYKRIEMFPKKLPERKFGRIYKDRKIKMHPHVVAQLRRHNRAEVFDLEGAYEFLKQGDVIHVEDADEQKSNFKTFAEVTHRYSINWADLIEKRPEIGWQMPDRSEPMKADRTVHVLEVVLIYEHQFSEK